MSVKFVISLSTSAALLVNAKNFAEDIQQRMQKINDKITGVLNGDGQEVT